MSKILLPSEEAEKWSSMKTTLKELSLAEDMEAIFKLLRKLQEIKYSKEDTLLLSDTPFEELKVFMDSFASKDEVRKFCTLSLPTIAVIAAELDRVMGSETLNCIKSSQCKSQRISKKTAASLIANGVLCLFPDPMDLENSINFDWFYESLVTQKSQQAKLRCILHYFERLNTEWETLEGQDVVFSRTVLSQDETLNWDQLLHNNTKLSPVICKTLPSHYDSPASHMKIVFTGRHLGGDVLQARCSQEELIFCVYPELIVAKLLMAPLENNESVIASNCTQFSHHSGSGSHFKFKKNLHNDRAQGSDTFAFINCCEPYSNKLEQYSPEMLKRDMNNIFSAFSSDLLPAKEAKGVATGPWAWGRQGVDEEVKMALQWIATSIEGRKHLFYATTNESLVQSSAFLISEATRHKWNVGYLTKCLLKYCHRVCQQKENPRSFFSYVRKTSEQSHKCLIL